MERTIPSEVTLQWLKGKGACLELREPGVQWYNIQKDRTPLVLLAKLKAEDHLDWANWLVTHLLTPDQCVEYAIFAAELVPGHFEKASPHDDRPRKAVEAAKTYLRVKGEGWAAKAAAGAAGDAAKAAAGAAGDAAKAAAGAAKAAAWAAAGAAGAAGDAAGAAKAAGAAGDAAYNSMLLRIIDYGISLIEGGSRNLVTQY